MHNEMDNEMDLKVFYRYRLRKEGTLKTKSIIFHQIHFKIGTVVRGKFKQLSS